MQEKQEQSKEQTVSTIFSEVHDTLRTDSNSGKSFFVISKDLGYVN